MYLADQFKTNKIVGLAIGLATIVLMITDAYAITVDFEDIDLGGISFIAGPAQTSRGFTFSQTSTMDDIEIFGPACGWACPVNGTQILGVYNGPNQAGPFEVLMTQNNGGSFDLERIDFATEFNIVPNPDRVTLTVIGNIKGGGTVSQTLTYDSIPDNFQTADIQQDFSNLESVLFRSEKLFPAFDNIMVSPTPLAMCDPAFVTIDPTLITVEPNGSDDTVNIQCALDNAVAGGVPTVKLSAGVFRVGRIVAKNFNGTFQGTTRTSTQVVTNNGSLDCQDIRDSGRTPANFKFIGGSPRVRFMNLTLGSSCSDGSEFWGMHFTGRSALESCGNDVVFGEVDRVDMTGPDDSANVTLFGIEVSGEGYRLGGCNVGLSGTFKVNRSTFSNLTSAIVTSLRSASPVDIRFNTFDNINVQVSLRDSNQDTTVAFNDFLLVPYRDPFALGVLLETTAETPPATTSLKINGNTFTRSNDGIGYRSLQSTGPTKVNLIVIDNTFDFSSDSAAGFGVLSEDTDKGIVSGNRFKGQFSWAIYIENPARTLSTTGWSITGNTFSGPAPISMKFSSEVMDSVFGPGQPGANVVDEGVGNYILP